jgi:hypothetical protein
MRIALQGLGAKTGEKKHHYNNHSGGKQPNRQSLLFFVTLHPDNVGSYYQGKRQAPDNNTECDLSD